MQQNSIVSLPVRDNEGILEGLITIGDIAQTYMDTTDSYLLSRARTQYKKDCGNHRWNCCGRKRAWIFR